MQNKQSLLSVKALAGSETALVMVYGEIGESWSAPFAEARDLVAEITQLPPTASLLIRINSVGGSVADGLAIYNVLKQHPGPKRVVIDGVAASIASVIAMAGDIVEMPSASLMMIHAPWGGAIGNADEMRRFADTLDVHAAAMVNAYASKTGKPSSEWLALLSDGADHWFTAADSIAAGLADALQETTTAHEAIELTANAAFGRRIANFIPRAPARIAASLRAIVNRENTSMSEPQSKAPPSQVSAATAERERIIDLRNMRKFAENGRPELRAIFDKKLDAAIEDPNCTAEILGSRLLQVIGANSESLAGGNYRSESSATGLQTNDFVDAASDALMIRSGLRVAKPHAAVRDLQSMSLTDMANACLSRAGRSRDLRGASGAIQAAMTTSDFPALLSNTLGKVLRNGYEIEPRTFEVWSRLVQAPDFKPQTRSILGSAPALEPVLEGGEYTYGALGEDTSLPYSVGKYGRIIALTLEAIRNDDLGAFLRVVQGMGQAAARAEADAVYSSFALNFEAGPAMQDGINLFHANHANLAASSVALDAAALSSARVLLRKQTAIGGGLLNLTPRFLLVSPERESAAEALLAASARGTVTGAGNELNPAWMAQLQLVVEPRLSDDSIYVLTSADSIDTYERAHLEGEPVPAVFEEDSFDSDVHRWKCRHIFGGRWLDWRGAVRVPISG